MCWSHMSHMLTLARLLCCAALGHALYDLIRANGAPELNTATLSGPDLSYST